MHCGKFEIAADEKEVADSAEQTELVSRSHIFRQHGKIQGESEAAADVHNKIVHRIGHETQHRSILELE